MQKESVIIAAKINSLNGTGSSRSGEGVEGGVACVRVSRPCDRDVTDEIEGIPATISR